MQNYLNNYFEDFISNRVNDIEKQITDQNEKVKKQRKDSRELFNDIMKALSNEDQRLMFTYEENRNEADTHYFKIFYKQGFMDGFEAVKNIFNVNQRDRYID